MNPNTKIVRNPNVIAKKVNGEFIILDPNHGNLYNLNQTAQQIWNLTRRPLTIAQIIEQVNSKFLIENQKSKLEIIDFINKHLNSLFFTV